MKYSKDFLLTKEEKEKIRKNLIDFMELELGEANSKEDGDEEEKSGRKT